MSKGHISDCFSANTCVTCENRNVFERQIYATNMQSYGGNVVKWGIDRVWKRPLLPSMVQLYVHQRNSCNSNASFYFCGSTHWYLAHGCVFGDVGFYSELANLTIVAENVPHNNTDILDFCIQISSKDAVYFLLNWHNFK